MTAENFCYWLQGLFELNGNTELSKKQVKMIKTHLGYVFKNNSTPKIEPYIAHPNPFPDYGLTLKKPNFPPTEIIC